MLCLEEACHLGNGKIQRPLLIRLVPRKWKTLLAHLEVLLQFIIHSLLEFFILENFRCFDENIVLTVTFQGTHEYTMMSCCC